MGDSLSYLDNLLLITIAHYSRFAFFHRVLDAEKKGKPLIESLYYG